jgi:DNA-binding MarR family transcriptional regulator
MSARDDTRHTPPGFRATDDHGPAIEAHPLPPEFAGLDEASVALFRAFGGAMRLHRQFMKRRLGDSDVHPGQGMCLNALLHHDGIPQRDLAAAMHVAAPTLSRMLRSMEDAGLVERRDDEADQRLTRVHLSSAGRALAEQARAALVDHIPVAIAALTPEERAELARLLDKLSASIARSLSEDDAPTDGRAGEAGRAPADGATP